MRGKSLCAAHEDRHRLRSRGARDEGRPRPMARRAGARGQPISARTGPRASIIPITATSSAKRSPSGAAERGIALCGSGIGIAIAANRNPDGAAARKCPSRSRPSCAASHNDANAIAMGARLIGSEMARACVDRLPHHRVRRRPPLRAASTSFPRPRRTPEPDEHRERAASRRIPQPLDHFWHDTLAEADPEVLPR